MRRELALCLALLIIVTGNSTGQPSPDDIHWLTGFHSPGLNGIPRTAVEFEGELVVAGSFNHAGSRKVQDVAGWDGTSWSGLGDNLAYPTCFAVYDGTLIAAGEYALFDGLNQRNVARWDGTTWSPVLPVPFVTYVKPVRPKVCAVYGGKLVIGGDFDLEGDFGANIVAWDGTTWSRLSTGINGPVEALAVLGSELIAGGSFTQAGGALVTNVAHWDGTTWRGLGAGLPGTVTHLAAWDGELWARSSGTLPYRWNGSTWDQVPFGTLGRMDALSRFFVLSDGLYAVGTENLPGGGSTSVLERWEAPSWVPVGPDVPGGISLVARYGGDLLALGKHRPEVAGAEFARLDGGTWSTIEPVAAAVRGGSAVVSAMCRFRGDVVVGGLFTMAGDVPVTNIARWDGASWHALESGVSGQVFALSVYNNDLIAGGAFGMAGGEIVGGLARWDGSAWHPFGGGANASVYALASRGDTLYVGGFFTALAGFPRAHIALWNGAWHSLGSGTDNTVFSLQLMPNGDLIAGGRFTQAGSAAAATVARWTGTEWLRLGDGIGYSNPTAFALTNWNGQIVAGTGSHVFGFDGTTWSLLGAVTGGQIPGFTSLTTFEGDLVVGGRFWSVNGASLGGIGRFDGASWLPFGGGTNGHVFSLLPEGSRLLVGGTFTQVGDKPSYGVAIWDQSVVPVRLLSFTASWDGVQAIIHWRAADGEPGVRFSLYRETEAGPRTWVADVPWAEDGFYSIADPEAPTTEARYWLAEAGRDGSVTWHGPAVLPPQGPSLRGFLLAQNRPNPVRGATTITFETPRAGSVEIAIYDLGGRRVATILDNKDLPAGPNAVTWAGEDERGRRLSPGVYFYTLESGGEKRTKKLLLLP